MCSGLLAELVEVILRALEFGFLGITPNVLRIIQGVLQELCGLQVVVVILGEGSRPCLSADVNWAGVPILSLSPLPPFISETCAVGQQCLGLPESCLVRPGAGS